VGHPLAPFLTAPQLATADHGRSTPLEPTPGPGLQTPMVLSAPTTAPDLGRAVDLSARLIDSYLLTGQYSTAPPRHSQRLAPRCVPPGHAVFITHAHFRMLSCSTLASRKSSRHNRYPGPREKYNRTGTRPSCAMDGLSHPHSTPRHAPATRSHSPTRRTLTWSPGGPAGHPHLMHSGWPALPARFTPA
jgi:hypothetical protein